MKKKPEAPICMTQRARITERVTAFAPGDILLLGLIPEILRVTLLGLPEPIALAIYNQKNPDIYLGPEEKDYLPQTEHGRNNFVPFGEANKSSSIERQKFKRCHIPALDSRPHVFL